ncbi:unnamed protein product, partial [Gulo gulo]
GIPSPRGGRGTPNLVPSCSRHGNRLPRHGGPQPPSFPRKCLLRANCEPGPVLRTGGRVVQTTHKGVQALQEMAF